jgi:hypothetical protein
MQMLCIAFPASLPIVATTGTATTSDPVILCLDTHYVCRRPRLRGLPLSSRQFVAADMLEQEIAVR